MKHYYAAQSPRGFLNEVNVHRFASREARDAWVEEHMNDGDVNSAACGGHEITAAEARAIFSRKSDAVTTQFNHMIDHEEETN